MEKAKNIVPEGWFKWERPGIDFPFYNDDSVPAWHAWLLIGVTLLVAVVMNVTTFLQVGGTVFKAFLVFLLPLAALLFVAHGNIGTIIRKPRLGDIPLILIVTVLALVYSLAAGTLSALITGATTHGNPLMGETMDAGRIALIFVQLFGEELFKINMMLGILLLLFRRSGNRKSAIVIATLVTALVFGLAHYAAYGSIVQILLVQGLGCIIDMFAYLKTKNILTSYAAHLLLDFVPLGLAALGAL